MTSIGLWTIAVKPAEKREVVLQADVRITNIALGPILLDKDARSTLQLSFQSPIPAPGDEDDDDEDEDVGASGLQLETTVIGSLTPGKFEQLVTDITLLEEEEYLFENVGKNTIYITGNYIDQSANMPPGYDSDSEDDSDDEGAYDLRDVSSDVEMDPAALLDEDDLDTDAERFEEVDEETEVASKTLKRPRDSEGGAKETKAEKKSRKKAKAADGSAVPAESADEPAPEKKDAGKKEKKDKKDKKPAAEAKTTASGLKIVDAKVGTGPQAKSGNTLKMRYIGKLLNGKTFDSNVKGSPFAFKLGKGEVIKGWDEGLVGMQVGGERVLTIPANLAYGKRGSPPQIPGNSVLTFEVKLLEIK